MRQKLATFVLSTAVAVASFGPLLVTDDADARGFSSRSSSFSRSSFRASPKIRTPSRSVGKSTKVAKSGGFWNSGSSKGGNKGGKSLKTGKKQVSLTQRQGRGNPLKTKKAMAITRHEQKFKKTAKVPGLKTTSNKPASRIAKNRAYRDTYSKHGVYNQARRNDPVTYYSRRDSYYNRVGWGTTPVYVYNSPPAYGMWDTTFLYGNMYNPLYGGHFAYHHQNDAEYRRWRNQAEEEAKTNAELRAQLAAADLEMAKLQGQPINPDYLPEGVDADIALASGARASALPDFRVCTGSDTGAYFLTTVGVMAPNAEYVNVKPVITAGTGQTLQFLQDGKCDAGWAQSNGYWNFIEDYQTAHLPFVKVFSPFREAVHLICHADGPSKLSQLDEDNKLLFPTGSGAEVTFRDWVGEDDDYLNIPNSMTNMALRVASNEDALLAVSQDPNSCMMYVAAPGGTKFMKDANANAKALGIVLIDLNDGDLLDTEDPAGNDIYEKMQLQSYLYGNLTRQAGSLYGSGDIHTLDMPADFLISEKWKAANPSVYAKLSMKVVGMGDRIKTVLKP